MATLASIDRLLTTVEAQRRQARHAPLPYVDPFHFATDHLHFEPDPWQTRVLEWTGKKLLLNCCRQSGKSTVAAILALHHSLYVPRSLILLVSPSLRQSSELFKKIQDFVSRLPVRPALLEDNRLSLQLKNASRIVSLPAKEAHIRGFSGASLIIEDESARVPDDLTLALRPMLAVSQGRHILMSTPFGRRGHFFECWEQEAGWEKVKITAYECPRISPEFLAEEKASMPQMWFDSEYNCMFTDTVDAVFSYEDVMNSLSSEVHPLFSPMQNGHNLNQYMVRG